MAFNSKGREIGLTLIMAFVMLFALTNVNQTLGTVYLFFAAGLALLLIFDTSQTIPFQRSQGGHLQSIFYGAMGAGIVVIASTLLSGFVGAKYSISSIIKVLSATTPALAQSVFANFVLIAVVLTYFETGLWVRAMEFTADKLGVKANKTSLTSLSTISLALVFSALFIFFHLTSKGVSAIIPLLVVGIMMFVSLMLAIWQEEWRGAYYMHVILNGLSAYLILSSGGQFL